MRKTLLLAAVLSLLCSASGRAGDLTDTERAMIVKTLGDGVLGEPVAGPVLEKAEDWFPLVPTTWTDRRTSGPHADSDIKVTLTRGGTNAPAGAWRLAQGTNHAQFLHADDKGLFRVSGQDHTQGVLTRYHPAQPMLPAGLKPSGVRKQTIGVKVYDLSDPNDVTHTGSLDLTLTYLGAFRVTVPAGAFDAALIRSVYKGKVGPAEVHDTQYTFFAKGVGRVASIEQENVSAFLLYHEDNVIGRVMVEKPKK